ncbi:hypothetical protein VNO78_11115 [Psophocarpus tetragonolobus]|uniref:Uncharacterized protein n=1 Tax=Psophocarpus tetragonolobus TaxID=3891 RepID=A0AAN9SLU4_PSOTE
MATGRDGCGFDPPRPRPRKVRCKFGYKRSGYEILILIPVPVGYFRVRVMAEQVNDIFQVKEATTTILSSGEVVRRTPYRDRGPAHSPRGKH